MIFHSGEFNGIARLYHVPSTSAVCSGAAGAPLSVIRALYYSVRRGKGQEASRNASLSDKSYKVSASVEFGS